jgi:hypothetical protein
VNGCCSINSSQSTNGSRPRNKASGSKSNSNNSAIVAQNGQIASNNSGVIVKVHWCKNPNYLEP